MLIAGTGEDGPSDRAQEGDGGGGSAAELRRGAGEKGGGGGAKRSVDGDGGEGKAKRDVHGEPETDNLPARSVRSLRVTTEVQRRAVPPLPKKGDKKVSEFSLTLDAPPEAIAKPDVPTELLQGVAADLGREGGRIAPGRSRRVEVRRVQDLRNSKSE